MTPLSLAVEENNENAINALLDTESNWFCSLPWCWQKRKINAIRNEIAKARQAEQARKARKAEQEQKLAEVVRRSEERIRKAQKKQDLMKFCRTQLITTMADCLARVELD